MASTTPQLDLLLMDTHNSKNIAIGDASVYPVNFSILSPTLEVTPPGYPMVSFPYEAKSIMILNSYNLKITCVEDTCTLPDLPDGIYKVKYSITPAYLYFVEKNFLRVDQLYKKFDTAYLKLDLCGVGRKADEKALNDIEEYIKGAIAAADNCALKLALQLYNKANTLLDNFINKCNGSLC